MLEMAKVKTEKAGATYRAPPLPQND